MRSASALRHRLIPISLQTHRGEAHREERPARDDQGISLASPSPDILTGLTHLLFQLQAGEAPNGTGFMITRAAASDLDKTNLIIGRVSQGIDVVEKIGALPFARPREQFYDGPFFQAALAGGDKRALTAQKGFNRPLKRIVVGSSGVL